MMNFRPTHDNVLVRRLQATETPGGIIIPERALKFEGHAEVVAVGKCQRCDYGKTGIDGPRTYCESTDLKPGDRVLYNKWAGKKVIELCDNLVMVRHEDVLAVIQD